ncbi:MAG: YebC/PmpR family DNA-binding transcriptional regulator [Clostridia bacterium]|nr:YebC/PmpR family DNA-binding transcriptional regulator [Clostridia bacterium]MBR2877959.1 YebC/PmpR family DNA-binding transcriptional regulator [Clostridia bacterium]MBR2972856.1 YebC/PmpR family DNA-binding transcriptional regulator [Clostridia bacterium]MBR3576135.1 YebC/PmpR family DNA-binding transcriptional regulator [Clostridia bacterium]
MSGHSKWSNIKHKKEKTDSQKAKIFTKIGREISVVVKQGGPDPASNFKLKDVITKARSVNMPNDNIMRCIKKAAGEGSGDNYEDITYEGYGPKGVAVIVETLTDNRNRTGGDMKHYFDKYGGNLGAMGCVSWMFDRKGVIIVSKESGADEEELMMQALDLGADDFNAEEEYFEILTSPEDFSAVSGGLEEAGYTFESAEISMIPQNYTKLTEADDIKNMNKLLEMLEDNDDVQNVWTNLEEEE